MKEKVLILVVLVFSLIVVAVDAEEKENKSYKIIDNINNLAEDYNKCYKFNNDKQKEIKRLMIVAHPDDETIFGGGHLLQDKYTVVCVTCGKVEYRVREFEEVMSKTDDDYIMLGYTDRENLTGPISNWNNEYNDIYNSLYDIINGTDWDLIVTHNPDGEYGHIHHIKTSEIVSKIANKNKLYYFGHWSHEGTNGPRISDNLYNIKMQDLISIYYRSQGTALNYNYNMLPYENWIKSTEW